MFVLYICESVPSLGPASPCSSLHILSPLVSLDMVYFDFPIFFFFEVKKKSREGLSSSMIQPRNSKGWTGTSAASVFLEVGNFQKTLSSVKWETHSAHLWSRSRSALLGKTMARTLSFLAGHAGLHCHQQHSCPSLPCSSAGKVRAAPSRCLVHTMA